MGKKVLLINGSFRKKNTYGILLQIGEILKRHDIETEILNLFDYEINDCTGCDDSCVKGKGCYAKDGMSGIMGKITESDGIVLSSPVYLSGVTSRFKAFVDRTNTWFHKPEPAGKPALLVATTNISGIKETRHFLDLFITGFGARKGGFIFRTGVNFNMPVSEKELSKFVALLENDKKQYRPAMDEIILFNVQKVLAGKSNGGDRKFWEEKKWTTKLYYYDCKMGLVKKAFSKMMFGILSRAIKVD